MMDTMLDFYKNYSLEIYRHCEVVLVEISPQLAENCETLLREKHRSLFENGQIKIVN